MKNILITLIFTLFSNIVMAQGEAFGVDLKLPSEYKVITAANSNVSIRKMPSPKSPVLLRYFGEGCEVSALWSNEVKRSNSTVNLMMSKNDKLPVIGETKDYYQVLEGFFEKSGYVSKAHSRLLELPFATEETLKSSVGGYFRFVSGSYAGLFIYEDDNEEGHLFCIGAFVDNVPIVFREVNIGITGVAPRIEIDKASGRISYGAAVQGNGSYLDYRKLTPMELQRLMTRLGISGNVEQNCLYVLLNVTEDDMQHVYPVKYPANLSTYTRNVHVGK